MSGTAFRAKGASTGQAARTVWFGSVPDRLNLLFSGNTGSGIPVVNNVTPANYGNLFETGHNATLGGFITAPDGTTSSMQLIQEDSTTNRHYVQAVCMNFQGSNLAALRFAAFLSGSGRRAILNVWELGAGGGGVRAVFDLAGGQIGVAAATWGSTPNGDIFLPYDTKMISVGSGIYLCWMDFAFYNPDSGAIPAIYSIELDNGTGTGAASPSYTGNGTSGVYVWKTNLMPVGAYAINTQAFFDDFLSTSTIDMANSQSPGFNWYRSVGFRGLFNPGSNIVSPVPSSAFSVAGSILTLKSTNDWNSGVDNQIMLSSASQLDYTQGTYVGTGWNTPALFEMRGSWNFGTAVDYHTAMWGGGLEWCTRNLASAKPVLTSFERDMAPNIELNYIPNIGNLFWPNPGDPTTGLANPIGLGTSGIATVGPGAYSANIGYGLPGVTVTSAGQQYFGDGTVTPGAPPNAHWTATNYPSSFAFPQLLVDYTQFHTYSTLVIPVAYPGWAGPSSQQSNAIGFVFFDGGGCGSASSRGGAYGWRPKGAPVSTAGAGADYTSSVEWQKQLLWLNTGHNTFSIDWVKVTQ